MLRSQTGKRLGRRYKRVGIHRRLYLGIVFGLYLRVQIGDNHSFKDSMIHPRQQYSRGYSSEALLVYYTSHTQCVLRQRQCAARRRFFRGAAEVVTPLKRRKTKKTRRTTVVALISYQHYNQQQHSSTVHRSGSWGQLRPGTC